MPRQPWPVTGSSPLTRGKQGRRRQGPDPLGLIPAHAGKTLTDRQNAAPARAHPRSRGENDAGYQPEQVAEGSSPLTRGKRGLKALADGLCGLIPAHAGKTSRPRLRSRRPRAHPRSRGENIKSAVGSVIDWGSSPLTRGKHGRLACPWRRRGLIPAHAGKTGRASHPWRTDKAHPRSRGENRTRQ